MFQKLKKYCEFKNQRKTLNNMSKISILQQNNTKKENE